ncbi:aminoglycoside phosphotransferase family protein [Patescibacteria group bacterium]|nr:aminoglycoside phosphotransferase family protein [Patescibacteria group bacterium]
MNIEFEKKIISLFGNNGKKWLQSIPELISKYEKDWKIKVSPPFELSYNYVCPAKTFDGKNAVLKLSFPENKEFALELEALKRFPRSVSIQILNDDILNGAVLIERAVPGKPLRNIESDDEQIKIASDVISRLHIPISNDSNSTFPSISNWFKAFERYEKKYGVKSGPVPKKLFDLGEGIFKEFLQEKRQQYLLHGDLHSENIISSQRGWIVIDPKGIIGEREFELGAYLRNPYYDFPNESNYEDLESRRILQFSEELGFDKERIRKWALACAIISILWFLEDEGTFKEIYVRNAELLNNLKI